MKPASYTTKITLIRPPTLELRRNLSSYGAVPPIGLAYVAAVLRAEGHHLSVIDAPGEALDVFREIPSPYGPIHMNGLSPEEIVDRVDPETTIVGITHMFLHEWPTIKEICRRLKVKLPNVVTILGGENATAFWDRIFQESNDVDYCVLGEGEGPIVELVQRLCAGILVDLMPGIACHPKGTYRISHLCHNGEPISTTMYAKAAATQLAKRLQNPDHIPWPAWDLFPVEKYMDLSDRHGVHRGRAIPMLATRGCPYQCTFCSNPQMWSTRYVTRKPQDVVDEMKYYVQKYRINNVNFCDLTAIIKKDWIIEFCTILKKENLDITWQLPTGTRSEALDEEVLRLVYETGCRNITYAPESGSERMLNVMKKKVKIPRLIDSLNAARRANMVTRVNFIVGHPQETRLDTWRTLGTLLQCAIAGCQDTAIMIFCPYPGSEDTKRLMDEGKVEIDDRYYYTALARSGVSSKTYNREMSTTELVIMQWFMLSAFYLTTYLRHPWRIIDAIHSFFTGKEQTQLDQLVRTKFQRKFNLTGKTIPGWTNWISEHLGLKRSRCSNT